MKCLHCQVVIHPNFLSSRATVDNMLGKENDAPTSWWVDSMECPACKKALLKLCKRNGGEVDSWSIYPRFASRSPAPLAVPKEIAEDFNEAAAVLTVSPKASAALSRRCLEGLLHANGFKGKNLVSSINLAIESQTIPATLVDNLDYLRQIGNFAAHPQQDHRTDTVLPVEPEEAEWGLEVLEGLFEYYYVQPARNIARRDAWEKKRKESGKPPSKSMDTA